MAAVFLIVANSKVSAASQPWIRSLAQNGSITVPAGKVLIIDQVNYTGPSQTRIIFTVSGPAVGGVGSGAFSFDFQFFVNGQNFDIPPAPIRLGPGMSLTYKSTFTVGLFGTVVDSSEFLASAEPAINGFTQEGDRLVALVDTRTTKTARVTGQSSTDLFTWTSTDVSVTRSRLNPRLGKISTPMDAPDKFLRASVR